VTHSFNVKEYLKAQCIYIEQAMPAFLPDTNTPPVLTESMKYSLFAGGKRIRPILLLATMEAFGVSKDKGLPAACAVEMVHTYSLIHDDLPAMDDDDLRRGQPTNHKKFGEATAILAGDGLLTHAFEVMCRLTEQGVEALTVLQLVKELSVYAGPSGMVGGQMADLLGEGRDLMLPELQYIHEHKTGDLLTFSVRAGAMLGGATDKQLEYLTAFARNIGLAFQIQDDILDVCGESVKLGKSTGSDESKNKATYPSLMGLDESRLEMHQLLENANKTLKAAGVEGETLQAIAHYIINRDR
jgi:geranylgeranyl diphosphate synthase type II